MQENIFLYLMFKKRVYKNIYREKTVKYKLFLRKNSKKIR